MTTKVCWTLVVGLCLVGLMCFSCASTTGAKSAGEGEWIRTSRLSDWTGTIDTVKNPQTGACFVIANRATGVAMVAALPEECR